MINTKNFSIYLPNPTKRKDGLGDAKIGMMIMVREEGGNTKKFVVRGIGQHGSKGNNKVWNLTLTPIKNWTGKVEVVAGISTLPYS